MQNQNNKLMHNQNNKLMQNQNTKVTQNENVKNQNKQILLSYYQIRGVAQPIRMLCYYLQIPYKDVFVKKSQENQIQCGFRIGLPFIEDGSIKLHDQIAILNYLCDKKQNKQLTGLTPQMNAKINQYSFKYSVQKKKIMAGIMEGLKGLDQATLDKKAATQTFLKKLIEQCKFLQICLKNLVKTKKYVFEYLTIIDFIFYEHCFYIDGFYRQFIPKDSIYENFIRFKLNFQKQVFFQNNANKINNISLFFQFSNPKINSLVKNLWKGPCKVFLQQQKN